MASTATRPATTYRFNVGQDAATLEQQRLTALTRLFDPATTRYLDALMVGRAAKVLEVAAGTGSIARWLGERVGPNGRVDATDVDLRHLVALPANVHPIRHDIVADDLPQGGYDLVHTRLLLEHLGERDVALERMARAVRPGGYLLVEEAEMSTEAIALIAKYVGDLHRSAGDKGMRTISALLAAVGADMGYASSLTDAVRRTGLDVVGGEIHSPIVQTGKDLDFGRMTMLVLRQPAVASGLMTEAEVDAFLAMTSYPGTQYVPFVMTSVWARRPIG